MAVNFVRDPGPDGAEYSTAIVTKRNLGATILATGAVQPKVGAEVKVGSRTSGLVNRLHVTVGSRVKKEEVIAELDDEELLARKRLAEADLMEAEVAVDYAKTTLKRVTSLQERELTSEEIVDQATNEVRLSEARLAKAAASLDLAEVELSYSVIQAPISGVVASVSTQEGEAIAAGLAAPTFVTIVDLDQLEVAAFVDEVDIGRVSTGQVCIFVVDSYPDQDFEGVVRSIAPKAVILANVVNYVVRIDISDSMGLLKPDMTANITFFIDEREVLAVPNQALRRREGGRFVLLLENGVPVAREITAGWRDERYTEVLTGLKEGDTIVVGDIGEEAR